MQWSQYCVPNQGRNPPTWLGKSVTAKKVIWKNVFGNKVLHFGTQKVLGKKSSKKIYGNKVQPFWDFIFWDFFSGSSMILYKKKSPEKSSWIVENAWEQRMFITMEGRDWTLKTPLAILNMQMQRKKSPFRKTSKNWPHFPKTFFSFPVTFCPGTAENWDFLIKIFNSAVFFPQKLFSCDFLT